jgi:glucose 1-dehydrogenase
MKLNGRVALITGANRGIGKGCALEMAREGADVAINYRTHSDEAEAVAAEVRALGRRALVVGGDVADRSADEGMVRAVLSELGKLDILVANAAASIRKPFLELSVEDMRFTLGVSLWGVFHCCQLAARQMVDQGQGGSIVVISSVHAVMPYKNSLPYNTAKAGINHMARTMANELAEHRVRVNIVEPGWTDTPGERKHATDEELREGGKHLPLGRLASIEDIAKGVAFLASDDASYITGATLRIDGGFVLPRGVS